MSPLSILCLDGVVSAMVFLVLVLLDLVGLSVSSGLLLVALICSGRSYEFILWLLVSLVPDLFLCRNQSCGSVALSELFVLVDLSSSCGSCGFFKL